MLEKGIFLLSPAEEEDRFNRVLDAVAGKVDTPVRPPRTARPCQGELERLWRAIGQLEQRIAELEAKPPRTSRSRKCPRCRQLTLDVIAMRSHPEFGDEGIKLQEIVCRRCGHRDHRLFDPNGFIC